MWPFFINCSSGIQIAKTNEFGKGASGNTKTKRIHTRGQVIFRTPIDRATVTIYYILIALIDPGHGYYIMQKVEELSRGKVRIAAGTMYGAIDNLSKQRLICPVPSEDQRRKVYQITELGKEVLRLETQRLRGLVAIADENHL